MKKSRTAAANRTGETQTRFRRLRRCRSRRAIPLRTGETQTRFRRLRRRRSRRAIPLRTGETENTISATAPTLFQPTAKPEGGAKPAPAEADGMPRTQGRLQPVEIGGG